MINCDKSGDPAIAPCRSIQNLRTAHSTPPHKMLQDIFIPLDNCGGRLSGLPPSTLVFLKSVSNPAARVVLSTHKPDLVILLLRTL